MRSYALPMAFIPIYGVYVWVGSNGPKVVVGYACEVALFVDLNISVIRTHESNTGFHVELVGFDHNIEVLSTFNWVRDSDQHFWPFLITCEYLQSLSWSLVEEYSEDRTSSFNLLLPSTYLLISVGALILLLSVFLVSFVHQIHLSRSVGHFQCNTRYDELPFQSSPFDFHSKYNNWAVSTFCRDLPRLM